ncbi:Syg1 family like protein [Aduncisulcus paluster]|uniref:Syg1 family like protein n=1 Tax=Aduncisulcus paluster TaxID=2918883 RepID=A0ABQ5KXY0_9EUKA|nr:Syg1 family like protein [Aduncisulcus paluster]
MNFEAVLEKETAPEWHSKCTDYQNLRSQLYFLVTTQDNILALTHESNSKIRYRKKTEANLRRYMKLSFEERCRILANELTLFAEKTEVFRETLTMEIAKVGKFYSNTLEEFQNQCDCLISQALAFNAGVKRREAIMKAEKKSHEPNPPVEMTETKDSFGNENTLSTFTTMTELPSILDGKFTHREEKRAKRELTRAFMELHRGCSMLLSFTQQNVVAFEKLAKKFKRLMILKPQDVAVFDEEEAMRDQDEEEVAASLVDYDCGEETMKLLGENDLIDKSRLITLMETIEEVFADHIGKIRGRTRFDKIRKTRRLLKSKWQNISIKGEKSMDIVGGILLGVSLGLLFEIFRVCIWINKGVENGSISTTLTTTAYIIQTLIGEDSYIMLRAMLFTIIPCFCLSILIHVWDSVRVNWKFIFQISPVKAPSTYSCLLASSFRLFIVSLLFVLLLYAGSEAEGIGLLPLFYVSSSLSTEIICSIGYVLFLVVSFAPIFPHAHFRVKLHRSFWRGMFCWIFGVQFLDFFFADILTSMEFTLADHARCLIMLPSLFMNDASLRPSLVTIEVVLLLYAGSEAEGIGLLPLFYVSSSLSTEIICSIGYVLFLVVSFAPIFPHAHFRVKLHRSFWRGMFCWIFGVQFLDFFFADILTSMEFTLADHARSPSTYSCLLASSFRLFIVSLLFVLLLYAGSEAEGIGLLPLFYVSSSLSTEIICSIGYVLFLVVSFAPIFPHAHFRVKLHRSFWRGMFCWIFGVQFLDFFFADILTSMEFTLADHARCLIMLPSLFMNDASLRPSLVTIEVVCIVARVIPSLIRFQQCIYRFFSIRNEGKQKDKRRLDAISSTALSTMTGTLISDNTIINPPMKRCCGCSCSCSNCGEDSFGEDSDIDETCGEKCSSCGCRKSSFGQDWSFILKSLHPHITNAIKYFTKFPPLAYGVTRSIKDIKGGKELSIIPLVIMDGIASIFRIFWDLSQDWGMFVSHKGEGGSVGRGVKYNTCLLKRVSLFSLHVFVIMLIIDVIVRLLFVNSLAEDWIDSFTFMMLIVPTLELFRRMMWCVLRVENEHTTNCGEFRVIHTVPLPFDSSLRGHEEEDNENQGNDDDDDHSQYKNTLYFDNVMQYSASIRGAKIKKAADEFQPEESTEIVYE